MAKSIKDVGEKLEKAVEKEIVKKEGETLKEVTKTMPSDLRVRVLKWEDGRRVYIETVPIDSYDKADPYAWIKRRYAKKHGAGEYIIEFVAPDGEVIKTSAPIAIEMDAKNEDKSKEMEQFLRQMNEALKLKEEAIEKKQEIAEKLGEIEKEKATTMMELISKQFDMMSRLYEERINAIKEQLEKSGETKDTYALMMELQRIRDDYHTALERISDLVRQAVEQKQPQYMDFIISMLNRSMEKNSFEETLKMINLIKETFAPPKEEKKDFFQELLENPQKFEMVRKLLGVEERKDFFQELLENPQKFETVKRLLGIEEKKDFLTELMENPQKFEIFKKLVGLDELGEVKQSIMEIAQMAMSRPVEEPRKDFVDELHDNVKKIKELKEVLAPILGVQPQPAKSFLELISTIVSSPNMPEIVGRIMEGFTRAKLIEQGYIPIDLAGQIVPAKALPAAGVPQQPQPQPQHVEQAKKSKKKEDRTMVLETVLREAVLVAANGTSENDTPEQFAHRIANHLFNVGKSKPEIAVIAITLPKRKREALAKKVIKEMIPDMPDEMLDTIIVEAENKIKELVENEL